MSKQRKVDIASQLEEEMFNTTTDEVKRTRYDEYGNKYLAPTKSETSSLVFISIIALVGSCAIGTMLLGPFIGMIAGLILFTIFVILFDQRAKSKQ